jgi:hemerythrin-like domain-containing protein
MVTHHHAPVQDAELTGALAEVIANLRQGSYSKVVGEFRDALLGSGDAFIDTLARHLLYEEEVLFPELSRQSPELADAVRCLLSEHVRLRELARELAAAITSEERDQAYGVARNFLAELYAHIEREEKVTESISKQSPSNE